MNKKEKNTEIKKSNSKNYSTSIENKVIDLLNSKILLQKKN